jgi:hypothetical protein
VTLPRHPLLKPGESPPGAAVGDLPSWSCRGAVKACGFSAWFRSGSIHNGGTSPPHHNQALQVRHFMWHWLILTWIQWYSCRNMECCVDWHGQCRYIILCEVRIDDVLAVGDKLWKVGWWRTANE